MDRDNIRFTGRFDFNDAKGPRFAWSGCAISARFQGSGISIRLKSDGENYLLILLDGQIVQNALRVTGESEYPLVSCLKEGPHEISLVRRNEFYFGSIQFMGFTIEGGELLPLPPQPVKRLEFIGDSITCGFGNEGNMSMEYHQKYDNAYLSYAAIASRLLGAECHIIGYSGFGIIRDYLGNEQNTLPAKYDLVIPEESIPWDFCWKPQLVGINLGTNDFGFGTKPDREQFIKAYINFIKRIRNNYPDTHILCIIGTAMGGEELATIREYVQEGIIGTLKGVGFEQLSYLELEHQKEEDKLGISGHPGIRTHQIAGRRLYEEIRNLMGW